MIYGGSKQVVTERDDHRGWKEVNVPNEKERQPAKFSSTSFQTAEVFRCNSLADRVAVPSRAPGKNWTLNKLHMLSFSFPKLWWQQGRPIFSPFAFRMRLYC